MAKQKTIETPVSTESPAGTTRAVEKVVNELLGAVAASIDTEAVAKEVEQKLIDKYGTLPRLEIVNHTTNTSKVVAGTHAVFPDVVNIINAGIPVYLFGPAGTGKNVIVSQAAEALSLGFYYSNAVTDEFQLRGFTDAHGVYQETEFYRSMKEGGIFFLDEIDAPTPEVLVQINAALANRYFVFPCGLVRAHEDWRVVVAGNTHGKGSDSLYVGRLQLDAATLDRFALVYVGYDENIENDIGKGHEDIVQFVRDIREAYEAASYRGVASYRAISQMVALAETKMPALQIVEYIICRGMSSDDRKQITRQLKGTNQYHKAFKMLSGV